MKIEKIERSLSAIGILAALATFTLAASAQSVIPVVNPVPSVHAELAQPLSSSSSSSSSEFAYAPAPDAPAPAASSAAAPAPADTGGGGPFSGLGVGFKIGTIGIGFDAATPLFPGRLNLRGGAGFFSYSSTFTASNDNINGTLKLNNADLMLDFFPFHGSFRLSAGATVYNNTAVNGTLTFAGGTSFTMGNSKYTSDPANPAAGTAALKFGSNTVPRFTLGWGNMVPRTGRLKFETEIGIEYIGDPPVTWNITGEACTTTSGSAGVQCGSETGYGPVAPADITQERTNVQNDINGLRVFPVVSIGLSYKLF
jgi:hypothetical protein